MHWPGDKTASIGVAEGPAINGIQKMSWAWSSQSRWRTERERTQFQNINNYRVHSSSIYTRSQSVFIICKKFINLPKIDSATYYDAKFEYCIRNINRFKSLTYCNISKIWQYQSWSWHHQHMTIQSWTWHQQHMTIQSWTWHQQHKTIQSWTWHQQQMTIQKLNITPATYNNTKAEHDTSNIWQYKSWTWHQQHMTIQKLHTAVARHYVIMCSCLLCWQPVVYLLHC